MSLSHCPKCWDTPCECGYEYRNWSPQRRQALADKLLNPPYPPQEVQVPAYRLDEDEEREDGR